MRPRSKSTKRLPRNLYCNKGYYSYRHPIENRTYGFGRNKAAAVTRANRCNIELLSNSVAIRVAEGLITMQSKQEIVRSAMSRSNVSGIYFLVDKGDIVYVGQSTNAHARIASHIHSADKVFEGYHIIPCHPALLLEVEATYIAAFQPKYNITVPQSAARRPLSVHTALGRASEELQDTFGKNQFSAEIVT